MTLQSTGPTLDDLTPHQLIDEIKQIVEQYTREVTTSRRTWPKSVRDRVLALARLGVRASKIAKLCELPSATVYLWCRLVSGEKQCKRSSNARFLALPPRSEAARSNATVGIQLESQNTIPTIAVGIQVLLPGGVEVRGLTSVEQVLTLYRNCRT